MRKEKIIVTGGAGFIGSNLVDALIEYGYEVHVIDNLSGGKKRNVNPKATLHIKDLTRIEQIEALFKGVDYVFHVAALPRVQFSIEHPAESNDANVSGTVNVLIASAKAKVKKVIYSASSSAYGDQKTMPLVETMKALPKSPYGLQKYIGELYCALWSEVYKIPTVSLRYFNVYGPRNSSEGAYALVIAKFIEQRRKNETLTITGDGKQTRDFTHVRDVVRANLLAMKSKKTGKGEVINIGAGRNVSINTVAKIVGGPVKHIQIRFEPKHTLADNSLARKLLGWKPKVAIEDGINELKEMAGIELGKRE